MNQAATEIRRSQIPGNYKRKLAAISRQYAAKFRQEGDEKRALNAEEWAKDFEDQQARHEATGRLVHFAPVPRGVCTRKDAKTDDYTETTANGSTIEHLYSRATYLGNVDCLVCRRWARTTKRGTRP